MLSLRPFLLGSLAGLLIAVMLSVLSLRFLPNLLVVNHQPTSADAIVALSGDGDGSRLRVAIRLYDQGLAPLLIHVSGKTQPLAYVTGKLCPDCRLEGKNFVDLGGSSDTRTDAEITMRYCLANNIHKILVVTSPYHTRRTQFVFNDIGQDLNREKAETRNERDAKSVNREKADERKTPDFEVTVISSGDYGKFIPPNDRWWADRRTLETVWIEFGKILYWELTPFMEFQGEKRETRDAKRETRNEKRETRKGSDER